MLIASWLLIALAVGSVARSIVPARIVRRVGSTF